MNDDLEPTEQDEWEAAGDGWMEPAGTEPTRNPDGSVTVPAGYTGPLPRAGSAFDRLTQQVAQETAEADAHASVERPGFHAADCAAQSLGPERCDCGGARGYLDAIAGL